MDLSVYVAIEIAILRRSNYFRHFAKYEYVLILRKYFTP